MTYLLLQHPGHNRVFYDASAPMARSELSLACRRLSRETTDPLITEIEGIRYLSFESAGPLTEKDIGLLSRLSFVFAIFLQEYIESRPVMVPIGKKPFAFVDPKISNLLKFSGKTNELFTRMMISIGLLSSDFTHSDAIRLLDPVAGKGTTLFESAVCGFHATGIEIESRAVHEAVTFFRKFLESERFRHTRTKRRIAGAGKKDAIFIEEFRYARTKKELHAESDSRQLGMICGSAAEASKYFRKDTFHLIIGDLPYGIQHGSKSRRGRPSESHDPGSSYLAETGSLKARASVSEKPGGPGSKAPNDPEVRQPGGAKNDELYDAGTGKFNDEGERKPNDEEDRIPNEGGDGKMKDEGKRNLKNEGTGKSNDEGERKPNDAGKRIPNDEGERKPKDEGDREPNDEGDREQSNALAGSPGKSMTGSPNDVSSRRPNAQKTKHGDKTARQLQRNFKPGTPTRNPVLLLEECLPGWKKILKPGGTVVVAWNAHLVSRKRLMEIFTANGLTVPGDPLYEFFGHRVDHSIKRDIIVARKP